MVTNKRGITQRGARLGQHFLTRPESAAWVADAAHLSARDTVVEIGPGKGILTRELLQRAGKVFAIEKDGKLVQELQETFREAINDEKLVIIPQDIRDIEPGSLVPGPYVLVANIPYYLTGYIIRAFLTAQHQPMSMTLLVQKEVAQRIVAKDGKQSLLSLSVQVYGEPAVVRTVKAGSFAPPPKVDSAILHVGSISRRAFTSARHEEQFFSLIRTAFAGKRKQVASTLRSYAASMQEVGIDATHRPESIPQHQWLALAQLGGS